MESMSRVSTIFFLSHLLIFLVLEITQPNKAFLPYSLLGLFTTNHLLAVGFGLFDFYLHFSYLWNALQMAYFQISYFVVSRAALADMKRQNLSAQIISRYRTFELLNGFFNHCFSNFLPLCILFVSAFWTLAVCIVIRLHKSMNFHMYSTAVMSVFGNATMCYWYVFVAASIQDTSSLILDTWRIQGQGNHKVIIRSMKSFGVKNGGFYVLCKSRAVLFFQTLFDSTILIFS